MIRRTVAVMLLTAALVPLAAQGVQETERPLRRRHVEGERIQYLMKGRENDTTYEVRATSTTTRNPAGEFVEEFSWSNLLTNGSVDPLPPAAQQFRLAVTIEGAMPFVPPDLSKAPRLIAPVTDLMTFWADFFLATHLGDLRQPGDRFIWRNPMTASWADGGVVVLGEDHVDFDVTLKAIDTVNGAAALLVTHTPPAEPKIRLTADWMRTPVADTPNNWVMVTRSGDRYVASVGKETFDVELRIDLADGKIRSATMDNPVTAITRDCADAALRECGESRQSPILRRVEMSLLP